MSESSVAILPAGRASIADALDREFLSPVVSRVRGAWEPQGPSFGREVRGLAAALSGYGLGPGSAAAVLGEEGAGTLRAGLAVLAAGATLVPLDPRLSNSAMRRALSSTAVVQAIASDEAQLARILELRPDLPALELVLLSSAEPSERKPAALMVGTAIEVGATNLVEDPGLLNRALSQSEGGRACLLVEASGETRAISRATLFGLSDLLSTKLFAASGAKVLIALPMGGVERLSAAFAALGRGATVLLPDVAERLDAGLDQWPADVVLLDRTGLERLHRSWLEDIDAMSWLGRKATTWAVRQGSEGPERGWKHRVAESVALRRLRGKLGGSSTTLEVFGAPNAERTSEAEAFFSAVGLSVRFREGVSPGPLAR